MSNVSSPALPFGDRVAILWNDSLAWLTGHSVQIVVSLVMGAAIVLILMAVKWVGERLCRADPEHDDWRTVIGGALSTTRLWFMVAAAAQIVATYSSAPPDLAKTIYFAFVIAATLQAALFIRELTLGTIEHQATSHEGLGNALGIIRILISIVLFALALILILSNLGVNVTGLVAGLGIGGIAIGLAAQGIFADLFAALSILFDRPFRRGDSVKWDETQGKIERIGLKSTRVRSVNGEEIIVSNKNLLDKELQNKTRLQRQRETMMLGITYETRADKRRRLPEIARAIVESVEGCDFVRCGIVKLGESSVDYRLQFDVKTVDFETFFQARHAVALAILERLEKEEIVFAYPTQTSYVAEPGGRVVPPYPEIAKTESVEA